MARGAYGEARRLWEEAADAHSGPGDEQLQRRDLMLLAGVESLQGDHARAVSLLRDVLASTRREGSPLDLALALGNLGVAEDAAGETEQGRRSMEESIALHRQDGRKPALAIGLCNLGYVLRPTDPVERARSFQREPRAVAGDRGTAHHRLLPRGRCRDPRRAWRRHERHNPACRRFRHPRAQRRSFIPTEASHGRHPQGTVPRGALRRSVRPSLGGRRRARRHRCRRLGAPSLGRKRSSGDTRECITEQQPSAPFPNRFQDRRYDRSLFDPQSRNPSNHAGSRQAL